MGTKSFMHNCSLKGHFFLFNFWLGVFEENLNTASEQVVIDIHPNFLSPSSVQTNLEDIWLSRNMEVAIGGALWLYQKAKAVGDGWFCARATEGSRNIPDFLWLW